MIHFMYTSCVFGHTFGVYLIVFCFRIKLVKVDIRYYLLFTYDIWYLALTNTKCHM